MDSTIFLNMKHSFHFHRHHVDVQDPMYIRGVKLLSNLHRDTVVVNRAGVGTGSASERGDRVKTWFAVGVESTLRSSQEELC